MSQSSAFQRFARELRRRHVPQTAAVYLVAAWAAIQFADVVVPNLNGPQWVVTAVIVAALVGFPVVLALAWIFEWGPEGIHRTAEAEPAAHAPAGDAPGDATAARPAHRVATPVIATVAILVVGIGSALVVAALLADGDDPAGAPDTAAEARDVREGPPGRPEQPELMVPLDVDSLQQHILRGLGDAERLRDLGRLGGLEGLGGAGAMDSADMSEFIDVAMAMAEEAELSVLLREPPQWRLGRRGPVRLAAGDTLRVEGVALDSAGVVAVSVDGVVVAETEEPRPALNFTGEVVGTERAGLRRIEVVVRTGDGREVRREYVVDQRSGRQP